MLPHVRRRDPTHAKTRTKTVVGRANAMLMSAVGLRVLQASGLKPAQRAVLAEFEEKGQRQPKLEDGVMIEEAITKYWVKWDGEATATTTKRLNITRLFERLLASKNCPGEWLGPGRRGGGGGQGGGGRHASTMLRMLGR